MLTILFLSFLLLYPFLTPNSIVLADDFNIDGDSRYCELKHTTAISLGFLPETKDGPLGLLYDHEQLEGGETQVVLSSENVSTLSDRNYLVRIPDAVANVSGPPGTQVDVLYMFRNEAGHSVEVSKVVIPFTQQDHSLGNWLNVASTETGLPEERSIHVYFDFRWVIKNGLLKEYVGPGVLEDLDEGFLILDTLEIENPINIVQVGVEDVEENSNEVRIFVEIENLREEVLNNISFEHREFNTEFTMQAYETVSMEYVLEVTSSDTQSNSSNSVGILDVGYFKIHNPNVNTQCSVYGNAHNKWFQGGGVTVTAFREDGGWVNGGIVQPEGNTFCISRIPYTMTSELVEYEKIGDDGNMEEEEATDSEGEQGGEKETWEDENDIVQGNEDVDTPVSFNGENSFSHEDKEEYGEHIVEHEEGVLGVSAQQNIDIETEEESGSDFVLPETGVVR